MNRSINKSLLDNILRYIGLAFFFFFTLIWLMPLIWIFLSSLKTYQETVQLPVQILPRNFYLGNFPELFNRLNYAVFFRNSVFVTACILTLQLTLSSLAAYAFARMEFPFRNQIFISLFIAMMVPLQMILIPRFRLILALGWVNTHMGVVFPSIFSVVLTFFIRQQILGLPRSLDESAYIDGANHWIIFSRIVMPLCKSAILATGLMCLVFAWNQFLWPLIVLSRPRLYTLSIGTALLQGMNDTRENLLMTAAFVVSMPIITIFLIAQRHFVLGVAMTGIKE